MILDEKSGSKETDQRQRGASLVEYALLVALVALVAIPAARSLGTQVNCAFGTVSNDLAAAATHGLPVVPATCTASVPPSG